MTSPPSCASRWNVEFDDAGAIGRRYRRQDEIGTPFCVTVDFDSLDDQAVTIRERDAMTQERVAHRRGVADYLATRLKGVLATPASVEQPDETTLRIARLSATSEFVARRWAIPTVRSVR